MIASLPDVKKSLKGKAKKGHLIAKIHVGIQEFGEGFDVCVDAWMFDKWMNDDFESYQMSEEEKFPKAEARAKRIAESLVSAGYKAKYTGLENC
ncbi:hypothetical protein [Bacillus paranthracis]|uniref:hypothetical protein n=1 Tax=Bacillus paranthracis TaxID=2026186 RepID=UPI002D7A3D55|nr:hypothetical protein [Bacillus paranthracis]